MEDKNQNKKSSNSKVPLENEGRTKGSRVAGVMQNVDKADKKIAFSTDALPTGTASAAASPRDRKKGGRQSREKDKDTDSGMVEKVVRISRVAKVTKGGTKLSFTALVVVGDTKGHAGYALGKAAEVSIAIKKALIAAKKVMVEIPVYGTTIPHQVIGGWCATRVLLKPASDGTGVIASGTVRAICDGAGIRNILTKVHRSTNPMNVVKATFDGLSQLKKRPVKTVPIEIK